MAIEISMARSPHWCMNWILNHCEKRPELLLFYECEVTEQITETCLNLWYPCEIKIDGVTYTSAGQYVMAEKARLFGNMEIKDRILDTSDPQECMALGRKVENFDKKIWDEKKEKIVHNGNSEKFLQNAPLRNFLFSTEDKILAEASPDDCVWGIGLDRDNPDSLVPEKWRGQNLLGFDLMTVRDFLAFMDMFGEFDEDEEEYTDYNGKESVMEEENKNL